MKNKFFALLILVAGFYSCNEHTMTIKDKPGCMDPGSLNYDPEATIDNGACLVPENKTKGFVLEYTATWCGPCGNWGAPKMHELYKIGDVVGITCHADGDPMYNASLNSSFQSALPDGGGIPAFYIGNVKDGDAGDMATLMSKPPDAGVTFVATNNGSTMSVKTLSEFFKDVTGDYYLSVYILESGIDGSASAGSYKQNGTSDTAYKHDFVLRTCQTPTNAFGDKIASGTIAKGFRVSKEFSIPLKPEWNKNLYTVAVLWKLNGTTYDYINACEFGSHNSH